MRNRILINVFLLILLLPLIAGSAFGQVKYRAVFNNRDIKQENINGFVRYHLKGCDITNVRGAPQLPEYPLNILLPAGKKYTGFSYKPVNTEVTGKYIKIYPAQEQYVLSNFGQDKKEPEFTKPNPAYYETDEKYPKEIVRFNGVKTFNNSQFASFTVYPLQYDPVNKDLLFHSEIEIEISCLPGINKPAGTLPVPDEVEKIILSMAENPVEEFNDTRLKKGSGISTEDNTDYIIITSSALVDEFKPLADWRTRKGQKSEIVLVEWISSNYTGSDLQEKVRNCIREYVNTKGTEWVLLGGDVNIIPDRKAYAMDCLMNPNDNFIPCDLYYSDLDGNWDANGNGTYGEVDDEIDLYPDVFTGRAGVEEKSEAAVFVNKVLTYEINPPLAYLSRALFLGEILWNDPYTNSGEGKDMIDNLYVPDEFVSVTKLYQADGNESREHVVFNMNLGYHLINHDGHAGTGVMSVGDGGLRPGDMDELTNSPSYSILYSIGCWPAAFDNDCIAEHFLTSPNGGGVAFIGNSRYGWGSPGNPGFGYSDRFDAQFYNFLFYKDIYHIGATVAGIKMAYIERSREENVYRWHQYQLNLLGDPAMPVWTKVPRSIKCEFAAEIPSESMQFPVTVRTDQIPVPDALVCLKKEGEVYSRGRTDEQGVVLFTIKPETEGNMYVTVTAKNYIPALDSVSVIQGAEYLSIEECTVREVSGNNDGIINPGERITLNLTIKNHSNSTKTNLSGRLTSENGRVVFYDTEEQFGELSQGASVNVSNCFEFETGEWDHNCADPLKMTLTLQADGGVEKNIPLLLVCRSPEIKFTLYSIRDSLAGNNNSAVEPGETGEIQYEIKNSGKATAYNVSLQIIPEQFNKIVPAGSNIVVPDSIAPDSTYTGIIPFEAAIFCANPEFIPVKIRIEAENKYSFEEEIYLTIGYAGFVDDMENGSAVWNRSGTVEQAGWQHTNYRSHSGSNSWYCGDVNKHTYEQFMNSTLKTPVFKLEPNSVLSLWHWYKVATYGVNGIYIILDDGEKQHTLDFIGSGGALGVLPVGNSWIKDEYDLSDFQAGSEVQVIFKFVSDNQEVAEGFYIDDISVKNSVFVNVLTTIGTEPSIPPAEYQLKQNYPNPFNSRTVIEYYVPYDLNDYDQKYYSRFNLSGSLVIYNILGQKVRTFRLAPNRWGAWSGVKKIVWDGTNDNGMQLASGVYIYQVKIGDFKNTKKMLYVK